MEEKIKAKDKNMEEKIKEKEIENEKIREFGGKMLELIGKMDALLEKKVGKKNLELQMWAKSILSFFINNYKCKKDKLLETIIG